MDSSCAGAVPCATREPRTFTPTHFKAAMGRSLHHFANCKYTNGENSKRGVPAARSVHLLTSHRLRSWAREQLVRNGSAAARPVKSKGVPDSLLRPLSTRSVQHVAASTISQTQPGQASIQERSHRPPPTFIHSPFPPQSDTQTNPNCPPCHFHHTRCTTQRANTRRLVQASPAY